MRTLIKNNGLSFNQIFTLLLFVITIFKVNAQIGFGNKGLVEPVKSWSISIDEINNGKGTIHISGELKDPWHLYSQFTEGGMPATLEFELPENVKLDGDATEGETVKHYSEIFEANEIYFNNRFDFYQKVIFSNKVDTEIVLYFSGQACVEDGSCVPVEKEMTLAFKSNEINLASVEKEGRSKVVLKDLNPEGKDKISDEKLSKNDKKLIAKENQTVSEEKEKKEEKKINEDLLNNQIESKKDKKTPWGIFIAGFLGGLLALLTPCVFPMIPMTVSFFTHRSKNRASGIKNALIYAFFIVAIYVSLGLIISAVFGSDALNSMATDPIFNMLFFIIFFVFGLSFLGAFEITLPSKFVNNVDQKADKGGLVGIFFMAFTLSLVSFSCTGPIIGSLLVEAGVQGSYTGPAIGMLGFSMALALPFALFAIFPSWLNSLPKSGGWLNSVKVVLGLLELALALKFLSVVDLANQWEIITREIFIAVWFVIAVLIGLYLIGKLKFSHDSDLKYISTPRIVFAILSFTFAVYLFPGMFGAPLKLMSGLAPPRQYSEDNFRFVQGKPQGAFEKVKEDENMVLGPQNILVFKDYEKGLAYAKKVNKPILLDFTGINCVNCRKMEDNVWGEPEITKLLNQYVIISLYVDDKKKLPKEDQYVSDYTGHRVRTIGNKWSDFQIIRFKTNSQPYYVPYSLEEEVVIDPVGYTPDVSEYYKFLEEGINKFYNK